MLDAELKEYLDKIAGAFDRRMDGLRDELRDVRSEMRDVREEVRSFKNDLRDMSQRISNVGMDYYEARRVRELRSIGLEARMTEVERRLSELEGGNGHPQG